MLVILSVCALSCYKDLSKERETVIPDIVITGIEPVIHVSYGQTVQIDAHVSQIGRTDDDFDYLWEMDRVAGRTVVNTYDYDRVEMSRTTSFTFEVTNSPSTVPYMITFQVTDKKTGVKAIASCAMYVESALGEGLFVAHSRDGGQTSEVDLAASEALTYGFSASGIRYTRDLVALANGGEPLQGRINAMSQFVATRSASFDDPQYLIGTDDHFYSFDNLTFKLRDSDKGLFNTSPSTGFRTTLIAPFASYCLFAIINKDIYACSTIIDYSFSKVQYPPTPSSIFDEKNVSWGVQDQCDLTVFDPGRGMFSYMLGWRTGQSGLGAIGTNFPFSLEGSKALGAGGGKVNSSGHTQFHNFLVQAPSGQYYLLRIDGRNNVYEYYLLEGNDLDKVVSFASCDNADICYYATSTDIYAILITSGQAIIRHVAFSPQSSGEKITRIVHYKQGWYGVARNDASYEFQNRTNRLQILVITYNESTGEGKIYLRPFNLSTGLFTVLDNGVLTGFGEISAVCPSLR